MVKFPDFRKLERRNQSNAGVKSRAPKHHISKKHRTSLGQNRANRLRFQSRLAQRKSRHAKVALKRVGIEDFRWHDLRHIWASWHAKAGTPPNVLQELGGFESVEMVRRYTHLSGGTPLGIHGKHDWQPEASSYASATVGT